VGNVTTPGPVTWTLTFDCHDAGLVARFWTIALAYVERPPPQGWDTWESWLRHFEVPEDEWDDGASIEDPRHLLPSISFMKVPEAKTVKNRVHLDLQVSGGRHLDAETRTERIEAMVALLTDAGGSVSYRSMQAGALDHVTMTDPEGNEFCVV
jgi:hypothetical protein